MLINSWTGIVPVINLTTKRRLATMLNAAERSVMQEKIMAMLSRDTEIMSFDNGWDGASLGGYNLTYRVTVAIKGMSRFSEWRDEDAAYHHLPGFGFAFELERLIIAPPNTVVLESGAEYDYPPSADSEFNLARLIIVPPSETLKLGEKYDFFEILGLIRNGNRFAPFSFSGGENIADQLQTKHRLHIIACMGRDAVRAETENLSIDIEGIIADFLNVFIAETPKFHSLKPLYQDTDDEGTRLWKDEGLQSKEFYIAEKKLSRAFLRKIVKILRRHKVKRRANWELGAYIRLIKNALWEYGPRAPLFIGRVLLYKIQSFKNYEKTRTKRLAARKERDREFNERL